MQVARRYAIALCAAVSAVVSGGLDRANAGVRALSPWDAQIYASAFDAAAKGDFAAAQAEAAKAADPSLLGHLELRRLLSPGHRATYEELHAWLERYGDLTGAEKIYALAKKRQPAGAPEPAAPPSLSSARSWALLESLEDPDADRAADRSRGREARELYYGGQVEQAYEAAVASGERWIAGLAAFRLRNYPEAVRRFESVTRDHTESEWLRAGAAFWAARSAIAAGSPELVPDFLRMAAAYPTTFYGLIAERQLGLDSAVRTPKPSSGVERVAYTLEDGPDLSALVRENVRARRATALAQVGLIAEASVELRAALAGCKSEEERRQWIALAMALDAPMAALQDGRAERFDPTDYPTPTLAPQGGFTLDPALVYAIVRQESRFNPSARSHVGATGLMQVMPATAAWFTGDARMRRVSALKDPATNLRLGQDYLAYLLAKDYVGNDLLRAVAAYNGGPGTLLKTLESLGPDADPLMVIESLPFAETRNYVERVMANYWIYRQMFGADTPTLDAVASGAGVIDARLDRSTAPGAQRAAVVDVMQGLE